MTFEEDSIYKHHAGGDVAVSSQGLTTLRGIGWTPLTHTTASGRVGYDVTCKLTRYVSIGMIPVGDRRYEIYDAPPSNYMEGVLLFPTY